jgi:hypothetical protein
VDQHHVPVEMRFIDMFMTAVGALVFLALMLVFLLPTTAQEEARRFDKRILRQWLSVLALAEGCRDAKIEMYVRYEGPLADWDSGEATGRYAAEFDASHPDRKEILAGESYVYLGQELETTPPFHKTANVDELRQNLLRAMLFFGIGGAGQPFSVYVAAADPNALGDSRCLIRPVLFAWDQVNVGERVSLTKDRPFAWLQRFNLSADGGLSAKPPRTDVQFQRELLAFSSEQGRLLCDQARICGTMDAHLYKIRANAASSTQGQTVAPQVVELYQSQRFAEARRAFEGRSSGTLTPIELVTRAAVYARLGQTASAQEAVRTALARYPELSIENEMNVLRNEGSRELMIEMMDLSGFPKCATAAVLERYPQPVRLDECVSIEKGLEINEVPVAEGVTLQDMLRAEGVSEDDAAKIEAGLVQALPSPVALGQKLRIVWDDNSRSQPLQVGVYEDRRHLGTVALSEAGTYVVIDEPTTLEWAERPTSDLEPVPSRLPRARPN